MISARKIRSLLATARLPNVPSVVSNVWLGIALAAFHSGFDETRENALAAVLLSLAGVLLYVSGNFLNDWYDREWDMKNRPERALPQRLFNAKCYLAVAIITVGLGIALATFVHLRSGMTAAAIAFFILIYTRWHKGAVWPVIPMGICRALLPVMGWLAFTKVSFTVSSPEPLVFIGAHALGLLVYVAGLSLSARYESMAEPPAGALFFSRALFIAAGLLMTLWWVPKVPQLAILGLIPYAVWLVICVSVYRRPIPKFVSGLLAGIPLVDWIATLPLALTLALPDTRIWENPFTAAVLTIPPLAFVLGRALQRLTSAT
jgi:4-hydroxybenzoate polyprenyltransferase